MYRVILENENGEKINEESVHGFSSAKKFAEDSGATIIKIFEVSPFLWDPGDYLKGVRKISRGKKPTIDWKRVAF